MRINKHKKKLQPKINKKGGSDSVSWDTLLQVRADDFPSPSKIKLVDSSTQKNLLDLKLLLNNHQGIDFIQLKKNVLGKCKLIQQEIIKLDQGYVYDIIDFSNLTKWELLLWIKGGNTQDLLISDWQQTKDPNTIGKALTYDELMGLKWRTKKTLSSLTSSWNSTSKNQLYESVWDIIIKLDIPDLFHTKKIKHYEGKISSGRPTPITNIKDYLQRETINTSKAGGISDITFKENRGEENTSDACKGLFTNKYTIKNITDFNRIHTLEEDTEDTEKIIIESVNDHSLIYEGEIIQRVSNFTFSFSNKGVLETKKINFTPSQATIQDKENLHLYFKLLQANKYNSDIDDKKIKLDSIKFKECEIKKRDKFYCCSVKYFKKIKSIHKYDVSKISSAFEHNSFLKDKQKQIVVITNNARGFNEVVDRSHSSYIKENITHVWGEEELKRYYKKLQQKLQSVDDVTKLFDDSKTKLNLEPRFHQELISRATLHKLDPSESQNFIWGAVARSGKTYMAARFLQLVHTQDHTENNYNNIVIITPFPTETIEQWVDVFRDFTGFEDFNIIYTVGKEMNKDIHQTGKDKRIFILSKQFLEQKESKTKTISFVSVKKKNVVQIMKYEHF